jgi:hypothetical protein
MSKETKLDMIKIFSFLYLFSVMALAQAPTPLPEGPLIRQPVDSSAWKITYKYGNDPNQPDLSLTSKPPPPPVDPPQAAYISCPFQEVIVTITRPLWHAVIVDIQGRRTDEWYDGLLTFLQTKNVPNGMRVIRDANSSFLPPAFGNSLFADFSWVNSSNYIGTANFNDRLCWLFKNDKQSAWVDTKTQYPVAWFNGSETHSFEQLAPPAGSITLPAPIAKLAQEYRGPVKN